METRKASEIIVYLFVLLDQLLCFPHHLCPLIFFSFTYKLGYMHAKVCNPLPITITELIIIKHIFHNVKIAVPA